MCLCVCVCFCVCVMCPTKWQTPRANTRTLAHSHTHREKWGRLTEWDGERGRLLFQSQGISCRWALRPKGLFFTRYSLFHKAARRASATSGGHMSISAPSPVFSPSPCVSFPAGRPGVNPTLLHLAQTTHTPSAAAAAAHQQRASVHVRITQRHADTNQNGT